MYAFSVILHKVVVWCFKLSQKRIMEGAMRKLFLVGLTLLFALLFTCVVQGATYQEIKTPEVKKMMDSGDVLVIYPLSKIEFNDLHIKGSVHIPVTKLAGELPQDKNKKLVFYCLGRK